MTLRRPITLFLRANHDVIRTVVGARNTEGKPSSLGLRQFRQVGGPNYRIVMEPHARIDQLINALEAPTPPTTPSWLKNVNWGDFPYSSQTNSELLSGNPEIVVLSLQAEVEHILWRHRQSGALFYFGSRSWRRRAWSNEHQVRLSEEFESVRRLSPVEWSKCFDRLLLKLRDRRQCIVILFTGETPRLHPPPHDYYSIDGGSTEVWVRNNQFIEAALELAKNKDVLIMNASAILVRLGVGHNIVAPFRYRAECYVNLAEHLQRVIADALANRG